jgi:hypothetical protein
MLILLGFSSFAFAETDDVVPFRVMYIPEDKIDRAPFPVPPVRYLPMDRQLFEHWVEQLQPKPEKHDTDDPYLSKIVLKAKLEDQQLTAGQGVFTFSSRAEGIDYLPLNPLGLAVNSLRWQDDSEAVLSCEPNGATRILMPQKTDSKELRFRWSLRSRKNTTGGIVFDIALPPCLSIELLIDLPESQVLTASAGLVLPVEKDKNDTDSATTDVTLRTWRVLLGYHSNITLTIAEDKTSSAKQKSAIRQTVRYSVAQQGLEVLSRVMFDEFDSLPEELLLELESPLRPVEVLYGNKAVEWTRTVVSPDITEIRVDLSPFVHEKPQELSVELLGPLRENQRWLLPRVRVIPLRATSPDIFWTDTRCGVFVVSPLRTRNVSCNQGVRVTPRTPFDWADQELHSFQFFQDDAQIELEVFRSIPQITVNSVAQIDWGNNEIQSTVYLDCSVTEGERYTLNVPVSEFWIIDSVRFYQPPTASPLRATAPVEDDPIRTWDVLETPAQRTLSVQLKRPLRPRLPVTLQLSCRLSQSQSQFRLADLSPLVLSHRQSETHYIAAQLNFTDSTLKSSVEASTYNVPQTITFGGSPMRLLGNVYPLNSRTQDIRFELEQMRPNYTAALSGNIYMGDGELIPTYRIRCTPIDSSIDRVFVHFTPLDEANTAQHWDWSLSDSSGSSPGAGLRPKKLSPDEWKELLPMFEPQNRSEDLERGEVWEIRLDGLQSTPFDLSAESSIPFADSMRIPLVSLPLASSQRGELTIESPQHMDYRIVSTRLHSIPIAPPSGDRYQDVVAAFRYDPPEELRRSQHPALMLQKMTQEERIDTAWIWSLRLDSRYEPEGMVRNKALFLVENQGKDILQITLPRGIAAAQIAAVWRDSQQIAQHYDEEQRTIDIALPVKQRFVSVAVEYAYQDTPLAQQQKLRPRYPTANVPILSGSWTSWFPSEFEVSLRRDSDVVTQSPEKQITLSKALNYLVAETTLRKTLWTIWDDVYYGKQRRLETEMAAQCFFEELVKVFHANPAPGNPDSGNPVTTWGDLIGGEKVMSPVWFRLGNETKRSVVTRLLIDKQALTFLGITPATPIENIGTIQKEDVREKLFEHAGLILLIATRTRSDSIKEYMFALTTPTTLSLNRQIQSTPAGHCVRMVSFEVFDSADKLMPDWVPSSQWLSETTLSSIPWSVSTQVTQRTALTTDWNAFELPINTEQPLYIMHRQKSLALQWIAFLSVVLITCRRPFSSPVVLFTLLIACEIIARSVAPCYIGIPSGAFLGVLVSLGFVLIRSRINPNASSEQSHDSTECSVSFVQTPLHRCFLLGALLTAVTMSAPVAAQGLVPVETEREEPYRVFYPTDSEGQVTGNRVWLPFEFFDLLSREVKSKESPVLQRWSIVKAVYQGSLIRGTSGHLECSDDFRAIYDIHLDASSATITLPNLPAVQGRFFWDSKPIQPTWNPAPGKDDTKEDTLSFLIENETLGRHTLEVALSPKIVPLNTGEVHHIAFAIPRVPDSTLRLTVPPDASLLNVPDAQGAVTANTMQSPVLTAELGQTNQLLVSWVDDPNRSGTLVNEVEQYFWIRVKPLQIELNALFRFRVDGGKIRNLTIQTDPGWTPSGQFRCDEHPITQRIETNSGTQIDFQTPVSGALTLRADFVLRDFYGVGNLRLPEFTALQSRVTKSMLGVSGESLRELNLPAEGRGSGFESGWQGTPAIVVPFIGDSPFWEIAGSILGRREDRPDAEYDLTKTESDWTINIRTKKIAPGVAVTQSVQFDTGESRVHVVGNFTTVANVDVFQQYFSTDRPIQIESVVVRDSRGFTVESRWQQIAPEQYIVFVRQSVSEKYSVTVSGFFTTDMPEESSPQYVPVLTFDNADAAEHSLNFFRTQAVIADIPAEQTGWSKSSAIPSAPESFAQSIPLGIWQKEKTETETKLEPLQFALSLNRPEVQCKTVLALHSADSAEQWTMTLDFTANITGGELESLSFRWDERWGVIQSVAPATPWTIESFGGQQTLKLSPVDLMRGEQQFRITVALNTSGATAVALPNVFPLERGTESFESEIIVDLPHKRDGEIIPWELGFLESRSGQAIAIEEQDADAPRLLYRAIEPGFSAVVGQVESRFTASFYDIGFLIKRDGQIIGTATVDLRNRGQDSFVLQMPPGYEPIQMSSAGAILERTRLEDNRWRINIGTSDYPQRFNILFRASLAQPTSDWNRKQIVSTLQFPFLEGVAVQDTLWTVAFEGKMPSMNVVFMQDASEDFGEHVPMSGTEATLSLIGLNLIREHNMLRVLNFLPVSVRQEEMRRWFLHWSEEWNTVADKVDYHIARLPSVPSFKPKLVIRPVSGRVESSGNIRPFWETMDAGTRAALRVTKERSVGEKFETAMDTETKQSVPVLNSQVYWQGRISDEMQYLFGAEEGVLRGVRLTSLPKESGWSLRFADHIWFWICLALLIPIGVLLSVRWVHLTELWLQFPHFWGMIIGILLWTFLPESFLGLIVIVLTIASFFRPSWTRRRYIAK